MRCGVHIERCGWMTHWLASAPFCTFFGGVSFFPFLVFSGCGDQSKEWALIIHRVYHYDALTTRQLSRIHPFTHQPLYSLVHPCLISLKRTIFFLDALTFMLTACIITMARTESTHNDSY